MKIRSLFFLAFIAAILGMVTACEGLNVPDLPDISPNIPDPDLPAALTYTVSFEANGGSPTPQSQTINKDEKVTEPAAMTKTGYGFAGWYKEAAFSNVWNFTADTVTGNTTLYAKWDDNFHTVSFVANGGNPAPQQQNIAHGYKAIRPQNMSKGGVNFEGWYIEATFNHLWNFNSDTVTENIVLYAKWGDLVPPTTVPNVPGTTLAEKLQWIASNATSNTNYLLEVSDDEYLNPYTLSYNEKSNIYIQLTGIGDVKTIDLYGSGSLFTIEHGVTLVLNENIVLRDNTNNNNSLASVNGGNLIMNNGSKITGGGVSVNGTWGYEYENDFINHTIYSGTFTMNGGEISGGGVYVSNEYNWYDGYNNTFTMNGGKISGNNQSGVSVVGGTFTMNGGEISGNTANYGGGGGVYVGGGTFTMTGGEISGNTAKNYGGGVYVSASFLKTGGIITGYSTDMVNGNVVKYYYDYVQNNSGHAVYVAHNDSRFIRRKETTVGPQDNLIYIRNEPAPPTISGRWDYTVSFTLNGGSPSLEQQYITHGNKVIEPSNINNTGYTFGGWYKEEGCINSWNFNIDTVTENITLYAKWVIIPVPEAPNTPVITVSNGSLTVQWTAVEWAQSYEVYYSQSATIPPSPSFTVTETSRTITGLTNGTTYYFWVKAVNANIAGAASPMASGVPGTPGLYRNNAKIGNQNLSAALSYISSNAVTGDDFFIVLGANESASPMTLDYSGKTVGITLLGYGSERTITLNSTGRMFLIPAGNAGITLTLDDNITLVGRSTNTYSLVYLDSGNLVINAGAKIRGNNNSASTGGGIFINGGTVTINDGTISGNTARGGGIFISGSGAVTMNGGTISGNKSDSQGGGVEVSSGTFIMYGGVISGNTANTYGGGIYINNNSGGIFKKLPSSSGQNSGIIYGNEETGVDANGVPLKNTASSSGHAVFSSSMRRNTTAGQTDHIDSTTGKGLSASGNAPFGQ